MRVRSPVDRNVSPRARAQGCGATRALTLHYMSVKVRTPYGAYVNPCSQPLTSTTSPPVSATLPACETKTGMARRACKFRKVSHEVKTAANKAVECNGQGIECLSHVQFAWRNGATRGRATVRVVLLLGLSRVL